MRAPDGAHFTLAQAFKKTACGTCRQTHSGWYDRKVRLVRDLSCGDTQVYLEVEIRRVACQRCGKVKQERLDWLSDNPLYTKRFAHYVGKRCQYASIKSIAQELHLDWHTVKELDKQYMRALLAKQPKPSPRIIGIDEISVSKGHDYRIVISDLERQQPIWFGGEDRSAASLAKFYGEIGPKKCARIELAVMDMWKPFRKATQLHAPQAAILFDKFHIMRHLGEALDKIRKAEYKRVNEPERRYIKGHKYLLLSRWDNLNLEGRHALKKLLAANKRLNTAYILKESFGQREATAR